MQLSIVHFFFLAVGLLTGGLVTWLNLRTKIAVADANSRATGEIERTSVVEQLKAAAIEPSRDAQKARRQTLQGLARTMD